MGPDGYRKDITPRMEDQILFRLRGTQRVSAFGRRLFIHRENRTGKVSMMMATEKSMRMSSMAWIMTAIGVPSNHIPMGVKVVEKSLAWQSGSSADAIVFMDYSFVDIRPNILTGVYLGMIADMDVGPVEVSGYLYHNYSAYDSSTHTAYVD